MSEACVNARQIVSLAYDGEPVTVDDLREAKAHCATCSSCTTFVSGLAKLRAVPAPTAPAAAIDRALGAVREERTRDLGRAAVQAARAATAVESGSDTAYTSPRARTRWTPWSGWAAAAAAVLIAVSIVTWQGVSYLNAPHELSVATDAGVPALESAPVPKENSDAWSAGTTDSSAGQSTESYALRAAAAPDYVVFAGFVFAVQEDEYRMPEGAEVVGTVTTDLGSGTPTQREVFAGEEVGDVLIAVDGETVRLAQLLVREFDGRRYGLQSPDITVFGTWPSLPAGLPQPSARDGSPDYDDAGTDALGVSVFTKRGGDPAAGFAIAPDTRDDDPASGNPNWTWWAPIR